MPSNKEVPKTYHEFKARFPKLAQAWDLTREGAAAGPLDEKSQALIKLAVSMGAMREGAVHSAVRKALRVGLDEASLDQAVALAASTLGFPSTVAVWTWIRDIIEPPARPK